jgi:phage shock protein PspC (stress-responsive transcriptional regulator)
VSSIWTIRRSATDAKLAGVCGGVARHWGVDPVLVRVGAVLLAFSGGLGVVLYVAGWLLIPLDGRATSTLEDLRGGSANPAKKWPKEAWVAIVTVACVLTFAIFGSAMPFGFGPAVVLALIWYFGYYKNRAKRRAEHAGQRPPTAGVPTIPTVPPPSAPFQYPGPPTAFTQAAEVWRQRIEEISRHGGTAGPSAATFSPIPSAAPTYPLYAEAPVAADPRLADPITYERDEQSEQAAFLANPDPVGLYAEPAPSAVTPVSAGRSRRARRLRLVALAVLGLTLAGLGIADVSGATIAPAIYLGAALLVVGLTLIAATWFGRARGILAVGLVLLLALLSVTVAQVPSQAGGFERAVGYRTAAEFPSGGDQHDLGLLRVDLSQLTMTTSGSYTAHIDAGRLEVIAPKASALNVVVRYALDAGVVVENDEPVRSGTDMIGTLEPPLRQASRPTLTLALSADVGEIRVQR